MFVNVAVGFIVSSIRTVFVLATFVQRRGGCRMTSVQHRFYSASTYTVNAGEGTLADHNIPVQTSHLTIKQSVMKLLYCKLLKVLARTL